MSAFIKRPRREPLSLQLTAMIDIFSLIVIFLVVGAHHENSDIIFPNGFVLPKSISKESTESTHEVVISLDKVSFKKLNLEINIADIEETDSEKVSVQDFEKGIEAYAKSVKLENSEKKLSLSVIADERVSYEKIYSILRIFRRAGFQNLYFVASPKEAKS